MSYSDNITASLDHSRNCLRRIARHDDTEFSHQSILNAMEKFVKSVNTMDETILVPCRLMDLKVGDENDPITTKNKQNSNKKTKNIVYELFNSVDLFEIYNLLNGAKADLLWGGQGSGQNEERSSTTTIQQTTTPAVVVKGHVRRPSTVSVTSTNSSTSNISDSESDAGVENDSGIEESQDFENRTEQVANDFRRHLQGLTRSLRQLTEAAEYLTSRYQYDIGAPV